MGCSLSPPSQHPPKAPVPARCDLGFEDAQVGKSENRKMEMGYGHSGREEGGEGGRRSVWEHPLDLSEAGCCALGGDAQGSPLGCGK